MTYNINGLVFNFGSFERNDTSYAPSLACGATTEAYGHYFEESPSIADKYHEVELINN